MGLLTLVSRNCKMFFKDKGMFFTSLITPVILLFLYVTFLGKTYTNFLTSSMPEGFAVDDGLTDAVVGGQLISSILAVCCVTVAFCSNLLMVQDKITGSKYDLTMTPVKNSILSMSYFLATTIATLIICCIMKLPKQNKPNPMRGNHFQWFLFIYISFCNLFQLLHCLLNFVDCLFQYAIHFV